MHWRTKKNLLWGIKLMERAVPSVKKKLEVAEKRQNIKSIEYYTDMLNALESLLREKYEQLEHG